MSWSVGRFSTLQFNLQNRSDINRTSVDLQKASKEVSSGRKADIFAELGARSAAALALRAREDETQSYIKTNEVLEHKLEATLNSITTIRDTVQGVLEAALTHSTRQTIGSTALQSQARTAIEAVFSALNLSFNGDHVFSGTRSGTPAVTRWAATNATTGLTPEQAVADIVGAGPTSPAEAGAIADQLDAMFASTNTASPNHNFEATIYGGTPAQNGAGQVNARLSARVAPGQQLDYGVQANDPAFRDIIQGLAMLASTDASEIGDEATYAAWMARVTDKLQTGLGRSLEIATEVGFHQQVVENAHTRLTDLSIVQRTQIGVYENADPFEAVTRMTNLQTQLEASYNVTARLSGLSILRFL